MHRYSKRCFSNWLTAVLLATALAGCKESPVATESWGKSRSNNLGPAATQVILQCLSDPDPRIRTNTIEAVAATGQLNLMREVQKLLKDDYIPVRFAAALAVGDTQYYLAKNSLKPLLDAPDLNSQIGAAYAMYKLGHKRYLEPIRQAVASSDQTVRANAVVLLGKCGDPSVLKLLYWAKNDSSSEPKVSYEAAEAIAKLGDETIMPKLWTMIISKYVDNKIIGIRAMGALGTSEAKGALLTKLDDDILEVRLAAAEQLAALGDNSGQAQVISVFEDKLTADMDAEGRERVMVLTALAIGRIGTPAVTKYLGQLIEDESKLVRLAAARAILQAKVR